MIDFLMVATRLTKSGVVEIYPKFIIKKSSDLMIRGSDFYAIWMDERQLWSTDEQDALQLIDRALDEYAKENKERLGGSIRVLHMWDAESGMIDAWHKYCQRQMRDSYHMLDEQLIFSNTQTKKEDYASRKLPYPLEEGVPSAWNNLLATLYSEEERHKIEWSIGAIVSGDSRHIQKFAVLYGAAGTGKSTILNIIQMLFSGYVSVFDAKALGSSSNSFALEAFKSNPLVAIQHDGDLSHIEDNTRLNSLVSHETMTVNEKFRSAYENRFKCFLYMGTNKPVKITDAKSGLIRRLIDITPTGNKIPQGEYKKLMTQIKFELGYIAYQCREVYLEDPDHYDSYIPTSMMSASNDFYNFILDSWFTFESEDETSLKNAWEMYKTYCEDAKVGYPYSMRAFKEEMKNYFDTYIERGTLDDGTRVRNVYRGFRKEKFEQASPQVKKEESSSWLIFDGKQSAFDELCSDSPAQYANDSGTPTSKWVNVTTKLADLDPTQLHYVKVPGNHIVVDFDLTDESGNKSLEKNLEEASKWPPTYAETSKSGMGIHLHYIYSGDVSQLSSVYSDHIEIKKPIGDSSLRRKRTIFNSLPVATITSGLPLKEGKVTLETWMIDISTNEKAIRTLILKNLRKEYHKATKPSVDFIQHILEEAYKAGITYDVTDMQAAIIKFAAGSTHQAEYCMKQVGRMKFKSKDLEEIDIQQSRPAVYDDSPIVFYDVEVFPNLFVLNWKVRGGSVVTRMINPSRKEVERVMAYKLVGFNCRKYDNHIIYAAGVLGWNVEQLYCLSQRIIRGDRDAFFPSAYDISYTDIYDFSSVKQSLKKFEIEMGIHHQELGLEWDKPVPEELWEKVAAYCDNDVIATEAVFEYLQSDFTAREILADVAGMKVNDTTNSLTTKIIFDGNRNPQGQFNYRDLSKPVREP